jgi:hypothetical protein
MRIPRRSAVLAILLMAAAYAAPASGQQAEMIWSGCWDLENAREDSSGSAFGERRVCVQPTPEGLLVQTIVDDEVVRGDSLRLDGTPREVEDSGCYGVEEARPSSNGYRLFTLSDLSCEGGTRRVSTGISALLSPDSWVDIQVVRVDGERELLVRRFRYAHQASRQLWERLGRDDLSMASRAARARAAAALEIDDVIEASRIVDEAAVEALLIESQATFELDGDRLLALADAEVPGTVIDLMIAYSFPDYFVVNDEAPSSVPMSVYPVSFYGYASPAFSPWFGWSYYPCCYGGYPPIGRPPVGRYGGKVVAGRGYARVAPSPSAPSGGLGDVMRRLASRGNGGGGGDRSGTAVGSNGGKATPKGATGKSGGTRTAKPRGH